MTLAAEGILFEEALYRIETDFHMNYNTELCIFFEWISWRRGVVVITTAQLHSTKPELRFCAGSNPARGVSEIRDGEDLRLSSVNHNTKTIHHYHHHPQSLIQNDKIKTKLKAIITLSKKMQLESRMVIPENIRQYKCCLHHRYSSVPNNERWYAFCRTSHWEVSIP